MSRCIRIPPTLVVIAFVVAFAATAVPRTSHAWTPIDRCRPVWNEQPSRYYVNQNGYSRIALATVRTILAAAMDAWAEPCCSTWRATEAGTTTGVAENGTDARSIISFRETSWPFELGDPRSTLAVTLTGWSLSPRDGACVDMSADMVFNAANHTFGTSHSFSTVDLRAVATHEAGHWLGLGHSNVSGSTMWPSYTDEGDRTLHADDEAGVCSLYPGDCSCTDDVDCPAGEECVLGACEPARCTSDADCPNGLACDRASGACVAPPCTSDADCPGTQVCDAGDCVIDADCPTCTPCESIVDCGGGEWQCAGDGTSVGFCTRICTSQSECPGNSACFGIEGQTFSVCLNDDADVVGVCPDAYVCADPTRPDPCDGMECDPGETCEDGRCVTSGGSDGCVVCDTCDDDADCGGGGCWTFDGSRFVCATDCTTDADCPAATSCQEFTDGASSFSLCLNADFDERGPCPPDFACVEPDPCEGRSCPPGQSCDPDSGACVAEPDAGDVGDPRDVGGADTTDAGVPSADCPICTPCVSDAECGDGACVEVGAFGRLCTVDCGSTDVSCPGNTACFTVSIGGQERDLCLNDDAEDAGVCPATWACELSVAGPGDAGQDGDGVPLGPGYAYGDEGCACASTPGGGNLVAFALLALVIVVRRIRR